MIVATAGHIDHGKTALVKALTGTDADRLPEEKSRGITIDLGFAYLPLPGGGAVGFVDVPGHERLVRTMLAGAGGADFALLAVAADDGVMPQTLEHLSILDLLGVHRGIVALTKADRAEPARIAEAEAEIRGALQGTSLEGSPIVPCSSVTGEGIPEIARRLHDAAAATRERPADGRFRLAVDRSFTLPGVGLIVTGMVHAGRAGVGDRLVLSPAGTELRVRGVHAQNTEAASGAAGQRLALNVTGSRLDKEDIRRGDWILAPELHAPTSRLDVRLRLLPSETRALRHWSPVHVHLGAASVTGRVSLLDGRALAPGEDALAQIVLDAPVGALWGDRFVIRDASAQRTVGGGRVLDPFPPRRGGRKPERAGILAAHAHDDHGDALRALLGAELGGLDLGQFRLARNLGDAEAQALLSECAVAEVALPRQRLGFAPHRWDEIKAGLLSSLASHHERYPDTWGATAEELAEGALPNPLHPVAMAAFKALIEDGKVRRTGQLLQLPGREIRLAPADESLWSDIRGVLGSAGLDPPRVTVLAERLGLAEDEVRPLLDKLGRIGWLCRASKAYYVLPGVAARLAAEARRVAGENPARVLTVGRFREATGISRHATMPMLEFFDRVGFTRRLHEGREIRDEWPEAAALPGEDQATLS
jgi:selenocysteine-specific elongation factor